MSDAALLADVLHTLREHGVDVEQTPDGRYRLSKGDYLEVVRLFPTVSRKILGRFQDRVGIPIARFYPTTTTLRIVPPIKLPSGTDPT